MLPTNKSLPTEQLSKEFSYFTSSRSILPVVLRRLLAFLLFGLVSVAAYAQSYTVEGHISDFRGKDLEGALVVLLPAGGNFSGGMPAGKTGSDGRYIVSVAQRGDYQLSVSKPDAGYPDTTALLFQSGPQRFPVVHLASEHATAHVDLTLPPPDGIVTGRLFNGVTAGPIPQAIVTLRLISNPRVYSTSTVEADGTFLYALPETPITFEISAPGFKTWKYDEGRSHKQFISLKSEEELHLAIRLQPN